MDLDVGALKQTLQERANLSPEQAEQAARVAIEFFSERVPQVSSLLDKAGGADDIAKKLGGFFRRD